MMVVVDIGNTKTMLGYVESGRVVKTWKCVTHKNLLADEYMVSANHFLAQVKTSMEQSPLCIASVVPHVTAQLKEATRNRRDVHFVSPESPVSFSIRLPFPQTLGADLIAAAEGAMRKYSPPLILIDAGTATTITVINSNAEFVGGAIAPGIGISADALFRSASALSPIEIKPSNAAIGNQTAAAVQSGICFGHAAMIEGMVARFEKELGYECKVLLTGGAIESLRPLLASKFMWEPRLTLEGLVSIYQRAGGNV